MTPDPYLPSPRRPGRILVVDDDPLNLELLSLELQAHPFKLTGASNAQEALAFCSARRFEGILTDVSMPGMDGLELCRRLPETLNAQTPLIFLSGYRVKEDVVLAGLEAGGMDFLPKPYSLPELVAKLKMMVRLSRQHQALTEHQRHQVLVEVAGGAAHELAQPLASAQLLLDTLAKKGTSPSPGQMAQMRDFVARTAAILHQIQGLNTYVTKPYAEGAIMDLEQSHLASGPYRIVPED